MFGGGYSLVKLNSFWIKHIQCPYRMADFLYYATELNVVVLLQKALEVI